MKVLAFAGSNSKASINKQLVEYAASLFENGIVELLDINDFEMTIFGIDKETEHGIPDLAYTFANKIAHSDIIIISLAEHNGAYSAAFKNIFDWISRIPKQSVFQDKGVFIMATSTGARGGAGVLEIAKSRFPWNGGKVLDTFSLPSFEETFQQGFGIINETLKEELLQKIAKINLDFSAE